MSQGRANARAMATSGNATAPPVVPGLAKICCRAAANALILERVLARVSKDGSAAMVRDGPEEAFLTKRGFLCKSRPSKPFRKRTLPFHPRGRQRPVVAA
jgi:hypothetical protein